jgi:VCBS repeat-containing protein
MLTASGEGENARAAQAAPLPQTTGNAKTAVFGDPPPSRARNRNAGGFGLLSLAAMTLATIKGTHAAENDTILDDDHINYKDLEHGSFELVTKELVPRHIIVDDPGETVVVKRIGSSVTVNPVGNDPARMEELHAAQQDVLANYARGQDTGSSAPPFSAPGLLQPINFIESDESQAVQHALAPIVVPVVTIADIPIVRIPEPPPPPPTLNVLNGPTEIDTSIFDTFRATSGTFTASSASGAPLTFGISGGTVAPVVVDGAHFDVSKAGSFGTLYVDSATGAYVYVPNDDAINALQAPTTESFAITVSDGTQSAVEAFTIAIDGSNDAAHISGATTGAAIEAGGIANATHGQPTASGTLTDSDVDNPPNTFTAVTSPTPSAGGYGTFTITATGVWTYTLNNNNPAVQALNVGGKLTDSFTVTSIDGTPQVVTITIDGTNDAAIISGTTSGSVTEPERPECSPDPTATGTLTDTDVDNPSNTFVAVTKPTESIGGYGTFTMTAAGVWIYTLDTDNCAVKALGEGCTLTDSFKVTTIDGTEQIVTITIYGADDDQHHHHHDHDFETDHHALSGAALVQETPVQDARPDDSGHINQAADTPKNDASAGAHWAHCLTGESKDDHFVFASADQGATRASLSSDFKSKSERIDPTWLGADAFAILALDVTSTVVPPHTIAWIYDGAANETTIYVNSTDHTLSIGASGLVEMHLPGMANIEASDFAFAAETGGVVIAPQPDDSEQAATGSDATLLAPTTHGHESETSHTDSTVVALTKWDAETPHIDRGFDTDTDRGRIELRAEAVHGHDDDQPSSTDHASDCTNAAGCIQSSIKPQLVSHQDSGLTPTPAGLFDGSGALTSDKASPVASSYAIHAVGSSSSAAPPAGGHGGLDWLDSSSRSNWQFNFSWNNDDKGPGQKAIGSIDIGHGGNHFSAALHGSGSFDFEISSTAHADAFHFRETASADVFSRSNDDGHDHATSAAIVSHVAHDLIV